VYSPLRTSEVAPGCRHADRPEDGCIAESGTSSGSIRPGSGTSHRNIDCARELAPMMVRLDDKSLDQRQVSPSAGGPSGDERLEAIATGRVLAKA
jgi:hypothetical protein